MNYLTLVRPALPRALVLLHILEPQTILNLTLLNPYGTRGSLQLLVIIRLLRLRIGKKTMIGATGGQIRLARSLLLGLGDLLLAR